VIESKEAPLKKKVLTYKQKIDDFSLLLNQHQKTSKFFPFFENIIHPQVWFSSFSLDVKNAQVTVSGTAKSFKVLGQQLLIFQGNSLIKETKLSRISMSREGEIHFTFNLSLNPIIFQ